MKDSKLQFDRTKHIIYPGFIKKGVRRWLRGRYGKKRADEIWEQTQKNYVSYLADCPDYGGKKNNHAAAIYGGLLIFALYPALPDQPPIAELQDFVNRLFMSSFTMLGKVIDGGTGLDIGCGSGALAIACAKRNPKAKMVGVDRLGKEYASFSRQLCEDNARAEGVGDRTSFCQGDALHLDFADGTFDAVTSNYVYHNIPSKDRQAILLETLRTLKKGGVFAIHDIMSESRYGDMQAFAKKLRDMGYEEAYVIDTANRMFMSRFEAKWMGLSGSKLLVGRK